jgi:hypothetical protein
MRNDLSTLPLRNRQRGTLEAGRQPSTSSQPPLPCLTPLDSQPELNGADDDELMDTHTIDTTLDQDGDGIPD